MLQSNYNGIFATHQHELFDEELGFCSSLKSTTLKRMGTKKASIQLESHNGSEERPHESQLLDGNEIASHEFESLAGTAAYRATFMLEDGACTRSFALQVALEEVRCRISSE